jgi:hypothetical protein
VPFNANNFRLKWFGSMFMPALADALYGVKSLRPKNLEARVGIEPTNKGFAVLYSF